MTWQKIIHSYDKVTCKYTITWPLLTKKLKKQVEKIEHTVRQITNIKHYGKTIALCQMFLLNLIFLVLKMVQTLVIDNNY